MSNARRYILCLDSLNLFILVYINQSVAITGRSVYYSYVLQYIFYLDLESEILKLESVFRLPGVRVDC